MARGPNEDYVDESNFIALMVEDCHSVTIASDLPAMLSAVEMRAPFLDQEMIALAFALSWRTKLPADGDLTRLKLVLKTAVSDLVPAELLYAPKRGFGYGIRERDLFLGPWRAKIDGAIGGIPTDHWLDYNWVRGMWEAAQARRGDRLVAAGADLLRPCLGAGTMIRQALAAPLPSPATIERPALWRSSPDCEFI